MVRLRAGVLLMCPVVKFRKCCLLINEAIPLTLTRDMWVAFSAVLARVAEREVELPGTEVEARKLRRCLKAQLARPGVRHGPRIAARVSGWTSFLLALIEKK